jgi:predicted amidophosphoribosyltransferase
MIHLKFMICTLCEDLTSSWSVSLCDACEDELRAACTGTCAEVAGSLIHGVYRYEGIVRDLLLRAKTKNHILSAEILIRRGHDVIDRWTRQHGHKNFLVVPAPSSFWGRFRGRFDLAALACCSWFEPRRVFMGLLPNAFYRPKRAADNSSQLRNVQTSKFNHYFNKIIETDLEITKYEHIVVVDDVMTSGFTMKSTFELLKGLGAQSVEGIVIASST